MAVTEIQNNFTGGAAVDPYRANSDQFELSKNVDIYYQVGRVRSYRDVDAYTSGQNDICRLWRGTTGDLYGLADLGGELYDDTGSIWNSLATVTPLSTAGGILDSDKTCQMLFEHQNYVYWWNNNFVDSVALPPLDLFVVNISRYNIATNTLEADWAQIIYRTDDGSGNTIVNAQPGPGFRHPLSDRAYFAAGDIVYYIDNAGDPLNSFTVGTLTIDRPNIGFRVPDEYEIVSLTYWETYLVVLASSKAGGTDKVYFWDQVNSLADFVKEIPEGKGNVIRNTGGQLSCVATQKDVDGLLMCYTYSGGEFVLQSSLVARNITGDIKFLDAAADVKNNTLFFGGIFDDKVGIWRFGLNKFNRYSLTIDRGANDDGDETDVLAIEIEGDTFTTVYNSIGTISSTENSADYDLNTTDVDTNNGCFLTTRRYYADKKHQKKELLSLGVATLNPFDETFTPSTQEMDVYFRFDDNSTWTFIGTHDAAATEFTEFDFQENVNTVVENLQPYYYIQFKFVFRGLVQLSEVTVKHNVKPQTNF
jgi:hypothetical protein